MALLEVENLSITIVQHAGGRRRRSIPAIRRLDVSVDAGEIVAVIGASGSGKSLLAHAILGILPENARMSGTIRYDGAALDAARLAALRGKEIALVPQSVNYLDPLMRVGKQVRSLSAGKASASQRSVFGRFRLDGRVERLFPFQLSGGMARRVLVATAAVSGARLIVADEPTPGMHVDDVEAAMALFKELARDGCAVLLITHDIGAALRIASRVAVFYGGTTVEIAPAADFAGDGARLRHPYSKALWQALPQNGFVPLPGKHPGPDDAAPGCPFAPRCMSATPACGESLPDMAELRGGTVRCLHAT